MRFKLVKRFFAPIGLLLLVAVVVTGCGSQLPPPPAGSVYVLATFTPEGGIATAGESEGEGGEVTVPLPSDSTNPTVAPASSATPQPLNTGGGVVSANPNPDLPAAALGRIAFMGPLNQNQNMQVFVVNADGTGLTHVSQANQEGYFPSLSPDGNTVAFVATGDRTPDIFAVNVTTGENINLTNKAGTDNQPVWSPDGSQIAFISDRDGGDIDIWVMDADGANPRRVARTPGSDTLGAWSPDGSQIVFSNRNELGESLWLVDVASGETSALIPMEEGTSDTNPTWSPDGTEIAFYRSSDTANPILYTISPDGENLNQVTDGIVPAIFPVYSPDGQWLVYTAVNGESQQLTALDRTTNQITPYPDLLGFATSWAATGDLLADTGLTQGPKNTGVVVADQIMAISYKRGSDNAPVQIIEFSDYQCPFCEKWYNETLTQLRPYIEDGTVQLIFVDYPLSFHPQADEAAQVARCVGEIGGNDAYWEIHDRLFETLATWSGQNTPGPIFNDLVDGMGLDGDAVEACMNSNKYLEQVQMGINEGNRLGVSGTPTFFINGNRLVGAQPWSAFEGYIREATGAGGQ